MSGEVHCTCSEAWGEFTDMGDLLEQIVVFTASFPFHFVCVMLAEKVANHNHVTVDTASQVPSTQVTIKWDDENFEDQS